MFLDTDERLVLLQHRVRPLSLEVLEGFRDAGIKTVRNSARTVSWHEIEPARGGPMDWSAVDQFVGLSLKAGLKVVLEFYWRAPDWVTAKQEFVRGPHTSFIDPDGVYEVDGKEASWLAIDPFHQDTLDEELEFLDKACQRYSSDRVLVGYAMPYQGERILPFWLPIQYTEEQCVDIVLQRQRVFAQYHDELLSAFHPWSYDPVTESIDRSTMPHHGTEHMHAAHRAILKEFPNHTLNHFISTYFAYGGPFPIEGRKAVGFPNHHPIPYSSNYKVWVGAQYTKGVVGNSLKADRYGLDGLVMGTGGHHGNYEFGDPNTWAFEQAARAVEILCGGR